MLLPPDRRDWVGEDDLVPFLLGAVERRPLSVFAVSHKGCGDAQFPPPMMPRILQVIAAEPEPTVQIKEKADPVAALTNLSDPEKISSAMCINTLNSRRRVSPRCTRR